MRKLLALLIVVLALQSAFAAPDQGWLDRQSGVTLLSRSHHHAVYTVNSGNGDWLFNEYRRALSREGYNVSNVQLGGPVRYMRATRDEHVIEVTLVNGEPGTLVVNTRGEERRRGGYNPRSNGDRVVDSNRVTQVYALNGNAFVLNGEHCNITLTGSASEVRINGSHNKIRIEGSARAIVVTGGDNFIRYRRGPYAPSPAVTNSGPANDIGGY
jgi:hypothetical protein